MIKGNETKEKIKELSLTLVHRKGARRTSIADIIESTGVKKGNLYFHYQSKENLILEVLKKALQLYEKRINADIKHTTIAEQIDDMIKGIMDYHVSGDISRGCIFGNLALEIGRDGSETSSFVEDVFKRWEIRFEQLVIQAVENGELALKEPAIVLARVIVASLEGGVMLSKIYGNTDALKDCVAFIRSVLAERRVRRDETQ